MSSFLTVEPQLSKQLCHDIQKSIDQLMQPFQTMLPTGWLVEITQERASEIIFELAYQEGTGGELAPLKSRRLHDDSQALLTGEDSLDYIKSRIRHRNKPIFPIYDSVINTNYLEDLTLRESEWLRDEYGYTNTYGGVKLPFHDKRALYVSFDGTHQVYDLFFAIQIAQIYAKHLALSSEEMEQAYKTLCENPTFNFWFNLIAPRDASL